MKNNIFNHPLSFLNVFKGNIHISYLPLIHLNLQYTFIKLCRKDEKTLSRYEYKQAKKKQVDKVKRNAALKKTGIFVGAFTVGSLIGSILGIKTVKAPGSNATSNERLFLKRQKEFAALEQAVERIYPEDEHGPGAIQLGVPAFIDKQLASSWGTNAKDYRYPPFNLEMPDVGQSSWTIREIFVEGLRKMEAMSLVLFQVSFEHASDEQQIEILQRFEADEAELENVRAASFFALLRETTLEGVYTDPMYSGNKDMAAWKMKEYPGARYSYKELVEKSEFVPLEPVDVATHHQVFMKKEGKK